MSLDAQAFGPYGPPLFTFRFNVEFARVTLDGHGGVVDQEGLALPICEGRFSEITGLEASLEPKTIKEGGANYGAHQRAGQVSFGTVVLKRGVTLDRDLWKWWSLFAGASDDGNSNQMANGAYAQRLRVTIMLESSSGTPAMTWRLDRAMPVKFKVADFNGRASDVGIEELHLVHEGLFAGPYVEPSPPAGDYPSSPTGTMVA